MREKPRKFVQVNPTACVLLYFCSVYYLGDFCVFSFLSVQQFFTLLLRKNMKNGNFSLKFLLKFKAEYKSAYFLAVQMRFDVLRLAIKWFHLHFDV